MPPDLYAITCRHLDLGSCNLSIKERNKCSNSDIPSTKCKEKGCCYDEWLQKCYKPEKRKCQET